MRPQELAFGAKALVFGHPGARGAGVRRGLDVPRGVRRIARVDNKLGCAATGMERTRVSKNEFPAVE